MPDFALNRQGPLAQLGLDLPRMRSTTVEEIRPAVRLSLRGGESVAESAGRALGIELPRQACRAGCSESRAALWLGPDEWLLIEFDKAPIGAGQIEAALSGLPHSLVEITHRQLGLKLSGRDAATALNAACPLDLSLAAFPVGSCTRTLFGKAEIVLWRRGVDEFHVETWRSFAAYVVALLDLGCRDAASLGRTR